LPESRLLSRNSACLGEGVLDFHGPEGKKLSTKNTYLTKLSFRNEDEMVTIPQKDKKRK
jgi:hypothetical protein